MDHRFVCIIYFFLCEQRPIIDFKKSMEKMQFFIIDFTVTSPFAAIYSTKKLKSKQKANQMAKVQPMFTDIFVYGLNDHHPCKKRVDNHRGIR